MNMLVYEKGTRMLPVGRAFDGSPDRELGKFLHFEAIPNDPELLTRILQEEKRSHDRLPEGAFRSISPPCGRNGSRPKQDIS